MALGHICYSVRESRKLNYPIGEILETKIGQTVSTRG